MATDWEMLAQAVESEPGEFDVDGNCLKCDEEFQDTYFTDATVNGVPGVRVIICDGCGNALVVAPVTESVGV